MANNEIVETNVTPIDNCNTAQPVQAKRNALQVVGDWLQRADPWKKILLGVGAALGAGGLAYGVTKWAGGRRDDDEDDDDPYFDEGPGSDDYED